MVAAELKVVGGKHAGQVIPLNRRKFLIGREQDCQLRPNSDMVSRHHCVFSVDDYSVRLRDLGSTNGTLVNGERIRKETVLAAGDRIVIGNLDFELVVRAGIAVSESDSKTMPAIPLNAEDTQVTSHTVLEIPAAPLTAVAPVASPQPVVAEVPAAAAPAPLVSAAETTMMPPVQMMPGQYGYPQMMPQMMPQMGYPTQVSAPSAPPAEAQGAPEVALPDPSTTGAKEAEVAKGSSGASPTDTQKPTGAADAIIKQYMGRRPGNS